MSVADRAAEVIDACFVNIHPEWAPKVADALAAAGLLVTDDELEMRRVIDDLPPFEDDPVAMTLGFTPVKPGVLLPGTPEHCHRCALDEIERLRQAMRHVDAVNRVVEAAKAEVAAMDAALAVRCANGTGDAWTAAENARIAAVRALREDEE